MRDDVTLKYHTIVDHATDIMAYLITCELERFDRKTWRLLDEVLRVSRRHNVCTCRVLSGRAWHSIQVLRRINRRDRVERSTDSVVSATRIQGDTTFRFLDNARPDRSDARDSVASVAPSPAWAPSLLASCIANELSRYVVLRLLPSSVSALTKVEDHERICRTAFNVDGS